MKAAIRTDDGWEEAECFATLGGWAVTQEISNVSSYRLTYLRTGLACGARFEDVEEAERALKWWVERGSEEGIDWGSDPNHYGKAKKLHEDCLDRTDRGVFRSGRSCPCGGPAGHMRGGPYCRRQHDKEHDRRRDAALQSVFDGGDDEDFWEQWRKFFMDNDHGR